MAKHLLGEGWQQRFMERVKAGGSRRSCSERLTRQGRGVG
ncbi:DUF3400 domain-containing protein [uncultured Thiohalocapsa sp.]